MEIDGILQLLAARGARPRRDWLSSCLQQLQIPQFALEAVAEKCFAQLLLADFNQVSAGVLPPEIHTLHKVELSGPFVLQVDETCDIAMAMRDRYHERQGGNRCLKLSMTDGVQRVAGIEYRHTPQIKVFLPAGTKIALKHVVVRRGLFLLVPETVMVLGGVVTELEAARQRVVEQINQPPRGNRNPRGTVARSLSQRAIAAAWPPMADEDVSMQEPLQPVIVTEFPQDNTSYAQHTTATAQRTVTPEAAQTARNVIPSFSRNISQGPQAPQASFTPLSPPPSASATRVPVPVREERRPLTTASVPPVISEAQADMDQDNPPAVQHSARRSRSAQVVEPFTYIALLKEKFLESREPQAGTIKCVTIGVKEFQFKDRSSFHLVVYVDDGSMITEATMDSQLVEKLIGHSSMEISAAFASRDAENFQQMKDKMMNFQTLLKNFEGYMNAVLNDGMLRIVALEDSVPAIDGWMLLDRLSAF